MTDVLISRQAVLDYIYNDLGLGDEENGKDIERQMELKRAYKYIKSLPPVTTEPCGVLISRQAVIDAIDKWVKNMEVLITLPDCASCRWSKDGCCAGTEECHLCMWESQYKPKAGCWVDDKCSVCGKGIEDLIDSSEWYRNEEPNFCPFCGVRIVDRK